MNVVDDFPETAKILLIGEKQNDDRIRKLPSADAFHVSVSRTRVDEYIIRAEGLLPLSLQVFEEEEAIELAIESLPVNRGEAGAIP